MCLSNTQLCQNVDCGAHGVCASFDSGYHLVCKCREGYGGVTCEYNVDDCLYQPCLNNGTCSDGVNNFTCACPVQGAEGKIGLCLCHWTYTCI